MTINRKGHAGWHQVTPKKAKCNCHFTGLAPHAKALIVTLAMWGLLPVGIADWLVNRGEPHDE